MYHIVGLVIHIMIFSNSGIYSIFRIDIFIQYINILTA